MVGKSGYGKKYHELFMKEINGDKVYCLEYDKETLKDMVIEKQEEIERLNNIINESAEEILKELKENSHLSYGVALAIRQKLLDYKEFKGSDKE